MITPAAPHPQLRRGPKGPSALPQQELPVEDLHAYFWLDHETGNLKFKDRPEETFAHLGGASARVCKWWNTRYAHKAAGSLNPKGYIHVGIHGVVYRAHRIVFAMANGFWPTGEVDHIDGNRCNNRPSNLRDVAPSDNAKNQKLRVSNTSGCMGVSFNKDRGQFVVRASSGGQRVFLGYFATREEAIAARRSAEATFGYHENHGRRC
jgi:hypothetical protein